MKSRDHKPFRFVWWILEKLSVYSKRYFIKEDLEEEYLNLCQTRGKHRARRWLWRQTLLAVGFYVKYLFSWRTLMLKNYLKIIIRNIRRHKGYSFINISGLAVGMAVFILISLYVQYELSYDRYHENSDHIYRIIRHKPVIDNLNSGYFAKTQYPLAPILKEQYPEVTAVSRISEEHTVLISREDHSFIENNFFFADNDIFRVFSFKFLKGHQETLSQDPNSIILSKKMSEKYFRGEDPIGKIIKVTYYKYYKNPKAVLFKVIGIIEVPDNSHLRIDFIAPFETFITKEMERRRLHYKYRWSMSVCFTYCLLDNDADTLEFEQKINSLADENEIDTKFVLQPLNKIHLHSNINQEISVNGSIQNIYVLMSLALIILLMASINYMNLTTARAFGRYKEVCIRKVVGAQKLQLMKQFFCESLIFTALAFTLSILVVILVLPTYNSLVEKSLTLKMMADHKSLLLFLVLLVFTGIINGSNPALFISSFKPVSILNQSYTKGSSRSIVRSILVIVQFSVSIILLVSTIVIKNQLKFIQNRDVGYSKNQIIVLSIRDHSAKKNLETIKNQFLKNPNILNVASSCVLPNKIDDSNRLTWSSRDQGPQSTIYVGYVDHDFIDVYDIEIAEGRNFSRDFPSDEGGAVLLNETALKILGWESPLGREIDHWSGSPKIVGILKDFNFHSLHSPIKPMYLYLNPSTNQFVHVAMDYFLSVKTKANDIPGTIRFLSEQMKRFSPEYPFEYNFFDEIFDREYRSEQKMGSIVGMFTFIAIFVASLGLLGLASFIAEQYTKEIGIRKVLGASIPGIIVYLSKGFVKWVFLANIIAWPVAYYFMNRWLQNFAYRIGLSVWIFILSGLAALCIALLTVSYQSIKAASANPVDSLRYE
jgi:putative ABC transport system permease protein